MITPYGARELHRTAAEPSSRDSPLRAWSAADQLVLDHVGIDDLGRVLIVNDSFGALTCGLATLEPTLWVDSARSRAATAVNLERNGLDPVAASRFVAGDELPGGTFDTVLVNVPKTSALLEHQLQAIAACSSASTRVVGAGMARHIHTSTLDAFERFIGPTVTSRATRKARLIHSDVATTGRTYTVPKPTEFVTDQGVRVAQLPGTFSADHLDVGSALLIDVLAGVSAVGPDTLVADLGCGNGVLGATLATLWPQAEYLLIDASDLAIAAASMTWSWNELGAQVSFRSADGFTSTADDSIDIVVTNPPFHQGHALDPAMTERLLADTARVLTSDGVAYVVAQRHLHMHTRMRRWFRSVEVASKHPSHVVLVARDPGL